MSIKRDTKGKYILLLALVFLVAFRLWYSRGLFLYYKPDTVYDDVLTYVKALHFASGNWMGDYNNRTLIKGCVYPVYLGSIIKLHFNYVQCLQWTYLAACGAALLSLKPIILKKWLYPLLFALLAFNPISTASEVTTTYLDAVYYSFALLTVSLIIGFALRYSPKYPRTRPLFALFAGAAAGATANIKYDSQWVWVVLGAALMIYIFYTFFQREKKSWPLEILATILCLMAGWAAVLLPISTENQKRYGVFTPDEFGSGSFAAAVSALMRPYSKDADAFIPVREDVRRELYILSPAFAQLAPILDGAQSTTQAWKVYKDDYPNGLISFALRDAAQAGGHYTNATAADAYWKKVAQEVNAACDAGLLPARGKSPLGIASPFEMKNLPRIFQNTVEAVQNTLQNHGVDPVAHAPVDMDRPYAEKQERVLGSRISHIYIDRTVDADNYASSYNPAALQFKIIRGVNLLYRWSAKYLLLLAAAVDIFILAAFAIYKWRARRDREIAIPRDALLVALLGLGTLLLFFLRCAMIGYATATGYLDASFNTAYLAVSYAFLYLAIGAALVNVVFQGQWVYPLLTGRKKA